MFLILLCTVLTFVACTKPDRSEEADRVTDELKELMFKNPERALAMVDSAEQAGVYAAADANLLRVNIYWNTGQKRMAAFCGEQAWADTGVKRKSKTYYSALMVMVKWYEENGEYGKANEMADEILADVEKDTSQVALTMRSSALTRKAECEIHMGHVDEAERLYLESIDLLMKGMTHPKGYWEIDPLFYSVLETSDFYLEHGKPEKALDLIAKGDTALARLEHSPEVPDKVLQFRRNNVTISQAMVYAANGQRDKAEILYLQHRQAGNLSVYDLVAEARYMAMTGRYDEAIRLFHQSDSLHIARGGAITTSYVNHYLMAQYKALQEAGRNDEVLALADRMRQLTDSIHLHERKMDVEQQQVIRQKEQEIVSRRQSLVIHRIILVAAVLICLLIAYFLWRSHKYNKMLLEKNRRLLAEIEQREREEQHVIEQLKAEPEESLTADQQLFRRICDLMDSPDHIYTDADLDRNRLAQLLGTNEHYVTDAISACTDGKSVNSFLKEYRLRYAAHLLATTKDSVALIAELSGFSRSSFFRIFSDAYGMSPSDYRKVARK